MRIKYGPKNMTNTIFALFYAISLIVELYVKIRNGYIPE